MTITTPTAKLSKRTDDKGCRWYVSEPDARGRVYEVWPSWRRFTMFGDPIGNPDEWIIERNDPSYLDDEGRTCLGAIVRIRGIYPTMRDARRRVGELLANQCRACGGLGTRFGHVTCVPCMGTGDGGAR